jgi:tetratricopeptide (TPR) repeat protein
MPAIAAIAAALDGIRDRPTATAEAVALLPAVHEWMDTVAVEDEPTAAVQVYDLLTVLLLEQKLGPQAVPLAERAVALTEHGLGSTHEWTLRSRNNLGWAYLQAGQAARATRTFETLVETGSRLHGDDHETVWQDRSNLGQACLAAGDVARALDLAERVLGFWRDRHGPYHPKTLWARHQVAIVHEHAGRVPAAVDIWRELLPDLERHLGPDSAEAAELRHRLGDLEENQLASWERLVAARRVAHGEPDERTLSAEIHLATALRNQGRLDDAATAFAAVVEQCERFLGASHPYTIDARIRFAITRYWRGEHAEAVAAVEELLSDSERALGRTHQLTLTAVFTLFVGYSESGRNDEADQLLDDWYPDLVEGLGYDDPRVRAITSFRTLHRLGLGDLP